ncbi:MAG: DNA-directed RNA polymerase subunit alpha, partial [candidate division WWE3 bacterium GW2011_GWC2_44_9]
MKTKKPKKFKHLAGKPETPAAKAILDTLRYKAIFSYPVSFYELWHFLIHKEKVEIGSIALDASFSPVRLVNYEVENMRVGDRTDYNLLRIHINTDSSIAPREALKQASAILVGQFQELAGVDLESKRLWLSRLFVVLVLKALGIYWNDQKPAGTVCPNIFMSSNTLTWEKKNVYIANEIALLYPLFSRNETYFRFMEENSWVKDYLANCYQFGQALTHKRTAKTTVSKLVDLLESVCMKAQKIHMQNKVTTEVIR